MQKVKTIEINVEKDLAKINPENIHCVYLGDDCVHFKAFALENDNIVCYEISDEVQKEYQLVSEKLTKAQLALDNIYTSIEFELDI